MMGQHGTESTKVGAVISLIFNNIICIDPLIFGQNGVKTWDNSWGELIQLVSHIDFDGFDINLMNLRLIFFGHWSLAK